MEGNSYAAPHRSMTLSKKKTITIALALADDRLLSRAARERGRCEYPRPFSRERRQAGRRCSRGYEFFPADGTLGTTGASGPVHTTRPSRQITAYWPSLRLRSSASATARFQDIQDHGLVFVSFRHDRLREAIPTLRQRRFVAV